MSGSTSSNATNTTKTEKTTVTETNPKPVLQYSRKAVMKLIEDKIKRVHDLKTKLKGDRCRAVNKRRGERDILYEEASPFMEEYAAECWETWCDYLNGTKKQKCKIKKDGYKQENFVWYDFSKKCFE